MNASGNNVIDTKNGVEKYFSFLVTDYGFSKGVEKWYGYEFHIELKKASIEIDIAVEADGSSLPWVTITDHSKSDKLDKTLMPQNYFYIDSIEDNDVISSLKKIREERFNPKLDRFLKNYKKVNYHQAHAELEHDYETWGRLELETIMKESAEIILRYKEILTGDFSKLPKRKAGKIKLDIYEQSTDGPKKVSEKMFKSVRSFFGFIKDKRKNQG